MSYYNKGRRGGGGGGGGGGGYRGGGFRGSRGGGDGYRGGRGSFNSSRGGGGGGGGGGGFGSGRYFSNNSDSFDSRPRSSFRGGGGDRFSGNKSRDDYHGSSSGYRDDYGQDRRASPEPPRKRGRPDDSPSYVGSRRSDERSFSSNDYSSRGFDKSGSSGGGYLTEKGSYREVRESKPDYAFRKPVNKFAPRGRGGVRGRGSLRASSYRGGARGRGFKSTTSYLARRRMESLGVRKRAGSDFRRGNPYRKRFGGGMRDRVKKSDDEEEEDDEELGDEEQMDEEVPEGEEGMEEEEEEEVLDEQEAEEEVEEVEDEENEGETEEDKEVSIKEDKDSANEIKQEGEDEKGEKKEGETKKKVVVKKKTAVPTKKVVKKATADDKAKSEENMEEAKDDENEEGEVDQKEDDEGEKKEHKDFRGRPMSRLQCPHCNFGCYEFSEYSRHLNTKKHAIAMRNLSTKLRGKLTLMRNSQRKKQRVLDDEAKANNLRLKTFFCQICKLNYKTLKSDHFASIEHKKMKEFLLPFCRVCKIAFKSPWAYENHVSELLHIKRKARTGDRPKKEKDIDLDPSSFMVLDAVGSGDEDESDQSGAEENKDAEGAKDGESSAEKKPKKKKEEIKLGAEYCKLIEVYYCELCKMYLPQFEEREKGLAQHCRSRTHLQRYVRHRDDESLRRRAVKLHKELEKEKEKEALKKKSKDGKKDEGEDEKKDGDMSDEDKHISELLNDGDEAQEDDGAVDEEHGEDDDSRQEDERYDRFKKSDKADKDGKATAAPNGSLSTDEAADKVEVKEEK